MFGDGPTVVAKNGLATNYVEKWTLYAATQNDVFHTVVIADALPNSVIEFTMVNNTGNNDLGVRAVGSVLNRQLESVLNSATTLTVMTNANKEVQFYTSDFSDTDFFFSAQY